MSTHQSVCLSVCLSVYLSHPRNSMFKHRRKNRCANNFTVQIYPNAFSLVFYSNIGECTLTRPSSYYSLIAFIENIFDQNTKAKESWHKTFEGYDEDGNETCKTVQESIEIQEDNNAIAKDGQGRRALSILNKKENEYFIKLRGPFANLSNLLPSNLEIQFRIYLTSPERYFYTTVNNVKPIFKITSARLLIGK